MYPPPEKNASTNAERTQRSADLYNAHDPEHPYPTNLKKHLVAASQAEQDAQKEATRAAFRERRRMGYLRRMAGMDRNYLH